MSKSQFISFHRNAAMAAAACAAAAASTLDGSPPRASGVAPPANSNGTSQRQGRHVSAFMPFESTFPAPPGFAGSPPTPPPPPPPPPPPSQRETASTSAAAASTPSLGCFLSSPLLQAYPAYQLAAAAALAQSQMAELQRNLQVQQQNFLRRQQMNEEHDQPSSTTQEPTVASVSGRIF